MAALTPGHLALILLAILLLFGYKKLPAASRSIGRSLRIFKGEMRGMQADDHGAGFSPTPVSGEVLPAAAADAPVDFEAEASAAEARAAELRPRATQARTTQ